MTTDSQSRPDQPTRAEWDRAILSLAALVAADYETERAAHDDYVRGGWRDPAMVQVNWRHQERLCTRLASLARAVAARDRIAAEEVQQ